MDCAFIDGRSAQPAGNSSEVDRMEFQMPIPSYRSAFGRRTLLEAVLPGALATMASCVPSNAAEPATRTVPAPSPDSRRLVALQLSDSTPRAVNNLFFNAMNVQKHYGLDNVKVAVIAYADGVQALYKDSSPVLERVQSLMAYDIEFVACGSTLEAQARSAADLVDGVTVVPAAVAELVERQLRGWATIHP